MERSSNPILHRLQQTLETGAPREEIAEALKAAETLGDELPPLLAFRAQERMDADRFLDRRRIAFGVGVALFVFVTGISSVGLTTLLRMRDANRDAANFQQLVDNGLWEEAKDFLAGLSDSDLSSPPFADGQKLVQDAIELEQEREEEFEKLVREIQANPSLLLDEDTISRLDELAKSDEEKKTSSDISAQADEQRLIHEAGRVESQTEEFQSLQQAVDEFFATESRSLDATELASRTRELQRELQAFIAENHLSNPGLAETAKQMADLLQRESKLSRKSDDRESMISEITKSVGSVEKFKQSANRFAASFPSDPLTMGMPDELRNGTGKVNWLDATESWIAVLGHPACTDPNFADSTKAKEWLELIQAASELDAEHPLGKQASSLHSHCEAIGNRESAVSKLRELLQSRWLGQMYVYADLRDQRYYSDASPERDSPTLHVVDYFANLSMERKEKNFGSRFQEQVLPRVRLAGHSAFASNAANLLGGAAASDFTPTVYRLLNDLRGLNVDTEIDPILKLDLVRRIIGIGSEGSLPIRVGFSDIAETLEAGDFDWSANWMSPGDSDPKVTEWRNEARVLLDSVRDWDARVKRMGLRFRAIRERRPIPVPQWVGWVAKEAGQFLVMTQRPLPDGTMFVVNQDAGATKMVQIRRPPDSSKWKLEESAAQTVGALVCVVPKNPSK